MKRHKWFGVKIACFLCVLFLIINLVNDILVPKKYINTTWPTTSTYKGFYQMKEDTVDVLFLGSSHAESGFIPQIMYDSFGIKSYNLGCEQQNMLVSYYWLEEALRYQKPRVLVLDVFLVFPYNKREALNTPESCTRMAVDAMKWSRVKWNAVKDICDNDEKQNRNSYIFKNVRYHTRWKNLTQDDFSFLKMEDHYELKGYAPLGERGKASTDFVPYIEDNQEPCLEMEPLMEEYLDRIIQLCEDKGIKVFLVKTPTLEWSQTKHTTICQYAEENQITFFDFNESEIYDASGFTYSQDMSDNGHCNIWGAEKLTKYLSSKIFNELQLTRGDEFIQWTETKDYYSEIKEDCELAQIYEWDAYIDAIKRERYVVFVSAKNCIYEVFSSESIEKLRELGVDFHPGEDESYYAVIGNGKIQEEHSTETLELHGSIDESLTEFSIVSTNTNTGYKGSILVDNVEKSKDRQGLNFVIYNKDRMQVVDSILYNGSVCR